MKERVSITIDEEISKKIKKIVESNDNYRNKSHFIEKAIKKYVEEEESKKK